VASSDESVERSRTLSESILRRREFGVVVAVLGLVILGVITRADVFLTLGNLVGVLRNAAVVTIIGYGMTMLITAGEFDLSVGSVMAIAAGLTAQMFLDGFPILFTLLVVLMLSILYGMAQGVLVTKLGLPSLIVTIGTLTLLRGGHLIITGNVTQTIPRNRMPLMLKSLGGVIQLPFPVLVPYTDVELFVIPALNYSLPVIHETQQTFNSFPLQIFWVIILMGLFHYLLFYTRFGYRSQATGGNERAARYTGIRTDHVKIANFGLVAALAAFAGVGQLAFTGNVSPLTGQGQELVVIAAVVIGGTNLFGGEGTIGGTLLGALVFAFTQNILVLAGFGTQLFAVFTGVFIIFAVGVDAITRQTRYAAIIELYAEPLRELATAPRSFFTTIDEEVEGLDAPLAFVALTTVAWSLPALLVVILTFVPSDAPVIPGGFEVFIVDDNVEALSTLPLFSFSVMAIVTFLTTIYAHVLVRAFGGAGTIDDTGQAVGYALAPGVLAFLPFLLFGLKFIQLLVLLSIAVVVVPAGILFYIGVGELHDLDSTKSGAVVLTTAVIWLATVFYAISQFPS
jgi:simple sugar transport system permease protein